MLNAIYMHLLLGAIITSLTKVTFAMMGHVVLGGGLTTNYTIDANFKVTKSDPGSSPGPTTFRKPQHCGFLYLNC